MAKISIIMPTYNREKIIITAIKSVLDQTEKDVELIIVDDGSKDNTKRVVQDFKDKRIKYFKRENHGIGASRNFGLEKATGEYITFLDSDDYLDKNFAKKMYSEIKKRDLDILICDYVGFYENGTKEKHHIETFEDASFKEKPNLINMVNLAPWAKLYNKKLFEKESIRFPEDIKYEDVNFVIKAFKEAKTIGKINEYLIYYYVDNVSETLIVNDKVFDIFKVIDTLDKDLKQKEYKAAKETFIISTLCNYNIQQRRQKSKKTRHKFIEESFKYMADNIPNYQENIYFKNRIWYKALIEKSPYFSKVYCDIHAFIHKR